MTDSQAYHERSQSNGDACYDGTQAGAVIEGLDLCERLLVVCITDAKTRRRTATHIRYIRSDTQRQSGKEGIRVILKYAQSHILLKPNSQTVQGLTT